MAIKELALITEKNNRKKKKEKEQVQLKAPTKQKTVQKPKTTTVKSNSKGKTYINKETISKKPTVQKTTQKPVVTNKERLSSKDTFAGVKSNVKPVKSTKKRDKVSTGVYDVYESGGKYYYDNGKEEKEIDKKIVENALKNNRKGVIGHYDKKGKFTEVDENGRRLTPKVIRKEKRENLSKQLNAMKNDIKSGNMNVSRAITDVANVADAATDFGPGKVYKNALKTGVNAFDRVWTGSTKALEGVMDTANDLTTEITSRQNYLVNRAFGMSKKEAKKKMKEEQKANAEWVKRDLVKDFKDKTGYTKLQPQLEEGSLVTEKNLAGRILEGAGGMLPALAVGQAANLGLAAKSTEGLTGLAKAGTVLGNLGRGFANQAGANTVLASTSYGSGIEEAYKNGATGKQARLYGLGNAVTELATEWLTGGIPGTKSEGVLDDIVESLIDKKTAKISNRYVSNVINAVVKSQAKGMGEGLEEAIAEIINPHLKNLTYSNGEKVNWEQVKDSALVGYAVGMFLNSPETIQEVKKGINDAKISPEKKAELKAELDALVEQSKQRNAINGVDVNEAVSNMQNQLRQSQMQQIDQMKKAGQIDAAQANQMIEQVNNDSYQQNRDLEQIAAQRRDYIENALKTGQISQLDAIAEIQALNNTLLSERERINGVQEQNVPQDNVENMLSNQIDNMETEVNRQEEINKKIAEQDIEDAILTEMDYMDNNNKQETKQKEKTPQQLQDKNIKNNVEGNKNLPHSSKVNDIGYHASNETFDNYDISKIGTGQGDNTQGKGINLASVRDAVDGIYGKNTYETNISLENAYTVNDKELLSTFEKDFGYKTDMDNISDELKKKGYDGIVINVNGNKLYTVFDSKNAKIKNNNTTNSIVEEKTPATKSENVINLDNIVNDFNAAKEGKLDDKKLRSYIETSNEATGMQKTIDKADLDKIKYEVQSNQETYEKAKNNIKDLTYEERLSRSKNLLNSDKRIKAVDMAEAQIALLEAAQSGRVEDYLSLQQDIAIMGTELGQTVQAMSMIQKMSPDGQLATLMKIVNRKQKQGNKAWKGVKINPDLVQKVLDSYDDASHTTYNQEQMEQAIDELKQDIADQMKISVSEKINEWRYLSMLGNPKTHVRNLVGNVAMSVVKDVKDLQSAFLQDLLIRNPEGKTTTLKKASKDVKDLASVAFEEMMALDSKGSKYVETGSIEQKRKIFNNKVLEGLRKGNLKALNIEDNWFKSAHFKKSFSKYLTAKGISTAEDINNNPQIVADAKNFAMNEAKIATFQQENSVANWIRDLDNLGPAAEVIRGAIVPFTGVPMNIAKTGIEYAPVTGTLKMISDVKKAPKSQKGNVLIDGISKQVTGTSLAILGYALAKAGLVKADAGDDKDDKFQKDIGSKMNYSVKVGDTSYDLSWLSPSAMPFFVGASAYEQWEKKEGIDGNFISDALASTLDPLSEMSVISSFTDVLSSYEKDGAKKIKKAGESTLQNYISQFIPTLFSQFARTLDTKKRNTYADKNSNWTFGEETYKQLAYKIPGARNLLPEQTDYLGRAKKEGDSMGKRAIEAFLSPASVKKDTSTKVTNEMMRLYKATGNKEVIPNKPDNYLDYNDKKYEFSQKEYNKFKKDYGKIAIAEIDRAMKDKDYQKLSKDKQAAVISNIIKYSKFRAKENYFKTKDVDYKNKNWKKAKNAEDSGYAVADYFISNKMNQKETKQSTEDRNRYMEVKKKGIDGKTFDKFRAFVASDKARGESRTGGKTQRQKVIDYIQTLGNLTAKEKQALYEDWNNNKGYFQYYK